MGRVMFIESNTPSDDLQAAANIVFEMEKGNCSKIVWTTNLAKLMREIQSEVRGNTIGVTSLDKRMGDLDKSLQNIVSCLLLLKDFIEKLEISQNKNINKILKSSKEPKETPTT